MNNKKYYQERNIKDSFILLFILRLKKTIVPLSLLLSTIIFPQSSFAVSGNNLFANWLLNEGAGSTATDISGKNHNGTLKNNPTWSSGHLLFDGNDDYVDVGSLDVSGQALTLTAWVKLIS
jgi:hypothetical protein